MTYTPFRHAFLTQIVARLQAPDVVWTDRNSGLKTLRNVLQVDRGMSFEVRAIPLKCCCGLLQRVLSSLQ